MRDVSAKIFSARQATARAVVRVSPVTIVAMREGKVPKGDPLPVAKVAAIQAVKNTPQLIPYCHTVPVDCVGVDFELKVDEIIVDVTVKSIYKTGVEMEAMAGAMVAALNLYDILKMIDESMEVTSVKLLDKTGGKSNFDAISGWTFSVVVVSDSISAGQGTDRSGEVLVTRLSDLGGTPAAKHIVPDESEQIQSVIRNACTNELQLLILTGGTGLGPRDVTPEALDGLLEKRLPGIVDHLFAYGQQREPRAMLGRLLAGTVGKTVVISLPGSVAAVNDAVDALFPYLTHAFAIVEGAGHE